MAEQKQVALIPGASRPIGRAIAREFGKAGVHLVLPFIEDWPEAHEEMVAEFTALGFPFLVHPCDLRIPAEIKSLISKIKTHYGRLDFLINNIERGGMPIVHGSYENPVNQSQWQLEFDTTLKAKRELYEHSKTLLKDDTGGSVTNISSIAGIIGRSGPVSYLFSDGYSSANSGILSLTRTWAREAAPKVRVNEVVLGMVQGRHGEGTRGWSLLTPDRQQALIDHTLLGRTAHPDEISRLVYFISTQASYLTGSRIVADGGYCLGGEQYHNLPPGVL